jgi:polysaccharide export outer membrane protein
MDQLQKQQIEHPLPPGRYTDPSQYVYRVGPQDILGVTVWDHPEPDDAAGPVVLERRQHHAVGRRGVAAAEYVGAAGPGRPYGQTVAADGTIFFPFVGRIRVAGKTVAQIREQMASSLARYVKNPQLDVRVLSFRSQKVQVTGEVKQPGPLAVSDVPLTLVDAISRSGGSTAEADLQRVRLTRDGKLYTLDANGVLDRGEVKQNVMLQPGDIINVPDRSDSRVFIMGEVKTPVTVPMLKGRLTIADALTAGGGILDTDANPRKIYVMRGMRDNPTKPEVFRLDMTQPDALMLSSRFPLQPLDVVYVSTASSVQFNRVLQQVLPTIQTIFYMRQITR